MERAEVPEHRAANVLGLVLIMGLSLVLLAYVGYGEAWRTHPRFELERLAAQGGTVQNALDPFLQAGLPLPEFPGFIPLTRPLLESDPSIGSIFVVDPKGRVLFVNERPEASGLRGAEFHPSSLQAKTSHFTIAESDAAYRVSLELRNKIEPVGTLVLIMPRQVVANEIGSLYVPRVVAGGLLLLLVFALVATFELARSTTPDVRSQAIAYGLAFFVMAIIVIWSLVNVYGDGIRGKTEALANSLSERLEVPLSLGLQLDDFSKLDDVFSDYQQLYPELSYVALTRDSTIVIHTDASKAGNAWTPTSGNYEYAAIIARASTAEGQLAVRAGIPESVIFEQIWRSAKNFFVLFLASGFLAMVLFNLLHAFTSRPAGRPLAPAHERRFQENVIVPVLFFAIFVEALAASFVPQYLQQVARASGVDPNIVSAQFTVYYAALAIALLPVGRFVDSGQMRWVLLLSVVLEIVSLWLMTTVANPYLLFPVRAMAGASHGIMATGAQAYLLLLASQGRMTRGASRFLFTYNSGMIAGTAMGALLAVYLGFTGVFALSALLVVPVLLFAFRYLPSSLRMEGSELAPTANPKQLPLLPSLASAVRDFGFTSSVLFVGIPAKIVNAGVVAFALPVVLAREAVPQEDIGQIIMFYPIGILLMSLFVSRVVDRLGGTQSALLIGTTGGALGVAAIGLLGSSLAAGGGSLYVTLLLGVGLLALGLAHGMINAPIVTHVASSVAAERLGRSTITSAYRFVERAGHMTGPILVSQLLIIGHHNPGALTWIGLPTIVLGFLFWLGSGRSRSTTPQPVPVRASGA